jgi:hypothetical protein
MVCYPKRKRAQSKCLNFNVLTKMPCNVQPFGQFGSNPDHYKLTYGAVYNILGERSFGLNYPNDDELKDIGELPRCIDSQAYGVMVNEDWKSCMYLLNLQLPVHLIELAVKIPTWVFL